MVAIYGPIQITYNVMEELDKLGFYADVKKFLFASFLTCPSCSLW